VRPLVHYPSVKLAVEGDERNLRQVDPMDLLEDLLSYTRIRCRQFLPVEGIQSMVAVEGNIIGWHLVALERRGIVWVIAIAPI
jgi:hypothetical protein